MSRTPENLFEFEQRTFLLNSINIFTTLKESETNNLAKLRSLNQPVVKIYAVHTGGSEALKADSDTARGLAPVLLLAKKARVMLTANLWVSTGLVNGAMGTVVDILFEDRQNHTSLPTAVLISFDQYRGPSITSPEEIQVIPIIPVRCTWEDKHGTYSRLQVPLFLSWVITTHKSQGLTLPKTFIDLGQTEFASGLSFVAISRVRSLSDILINHFTFERLQRIKKCKRLKERIDEEKRLLEIEK
jgi:ATP-dependent exoDNAse (exonuclease V) alpha subunit